MNDRDKLKENIENYIWEMNRETRIDRLHKLKREELEELSEKRIVSELTDKIMNNLPYICPDCHLILEVSTVYCNDNTCKCIPCGYEFDI